MLGESRLGGETPVDPGEHQLVVVTPDGQSFVKRVGVAEATIAEIRIDPPVGFVVVPPHKRSAARARLQPLGYAAKRGGDPAVWAWVAGGVGAAGAIGASVFWYVREKAIDDLNNGCSTDNICPTNLKSTQTRGEHASVAAPVFLGIGLLGLSIATYGILTSERSGIVTDSKSSSNVRVQFGGDTHFGGVNVAGAF